MFLVDIIIIIFFALGFLIGFKHGVLREAVSLVGIIAITILSFILKNPISVFLYNHLPFFKFDFIIKGSSVFNILLYEIIAFLIVFSILFIIYKIILQATSLFDKLLTMTIILSLPSKLLGGIIGIIKHYILVFIVLFVISLPVFSINIGSSYIGDFILNDTPVLSSATVDSIKAFNEIDDLIKKYKNKSDETFNQEALDLLIKYKAITKENATELINNGKLKGLKVN